jgi:hypothetical protein
MSNVKRYKFTSVEKVINFYAGCNPARYKPQNLLEPERCNNEALEVDIVRWDGVSTSFGGAESAWCLVGIIIDKTLKQYSRESIGYKAFKLCYCDFDRRISVAQIMDGKYMPGTPEELKIYRASKRTIYKHLEDIKEEIAQRCRRADLLPPENK